MSKRIRIKEATKDLLLKSIPSIMGLNCVIKCSQTVATNGSSSICVVVYDTLTAETAVRFFNEELEAALFIERWV